ncbi:MAG: hypothetical protein DRH17_13475 [Deltaproteobacteria bacterium]|nr:MAG: hypothetical protein DRH17_13475 [Deltaproteobacteria bacterium]
MHKIVVLAGIISFFGISFCYAQAEEEITVTTYYPSPYGSYRELKWGDYPDTRGTLSSDQGSSIELGGSGTPYIDFSNDMTTDYDVRLRLTGDDTLALEGGTHDIAENIPAEEGLEDGDVVIIDTENKIKVKKSTKPYDTLVAGVISGEPGFLIQGNGEGLPLALAGRVKAKVTTENGAIEIGDLLTTSSIPGYAMRADADNLKPGMLLGKALEPLEEGKGKIVVLVTLQ